jgi:stage II sporulation protein D
VSAPFERPRRYGGLGSFLALAALLLAGLWVTACRSAPPGGAGTAADEAPPPSGAPPERVAPEAPLPLPEEGADAPAPSASAPPADEPPRWPANVEDGRVLVRVGLASDLARYELPCCEGEVTISVDGESVTLRPPLDVEPAAAGVAAPERRLQVAALRDEGQAETLSRDLSARTGWPADVRFDASSGLYRVRVGRFATEPEVEAGRRRVAGLGFGSAWPVEEGGTLTEPAMRVRSGERSFRVHGRWLAVRPTEGGGLPVSTYQRSGRFRGRLLLFLNARGSLNLVNELPLEEYLRGVVPRELGPELYPRLEALKAQAVAARTYTLRHLGEFAGEGFDICAEPRCQVYGGMAAEHPLSDRAVTETEGEILVAGDEIVEALYSATCGGHTEDARTVFPWLDASYLRGVPCPEGDAVRLAGVVAAGTPFPDGLIGRLVPAPGSARGREALQERLEVLARTAGLPATGDRLHSLEREEVRRYVRSVFDMVLEPSLLVEPGVHRSGAGPDGDAAGVRRVASERVSDREAEWLMLGLARVLGLMEEEEVRFRAVEHGSLVVAGGSGGGSTDVRRLELPSDLATFARTPAAGGGESAAAELALLPGDALVLYRWRGRLAAVVRDGGPDAPRPDSHPARASRFRTWTRFRSDGELARLVAERYPGLGFRGLEVLERGVSGRVGRLRILGDGGRSEVVEGLAVRWTLDLPDTRFEARRATGPGRAPGWSFTGGGWGHGVGMCQIGAYTLAGRGSSYREILEHYYTGARLGRARAR